MDNAATLSACGAYRYTLTRRIPSMLRWVKPCLFVMLNPSIADATQDDPTIRRCIGFAKRERCTVMTVVNLFALRATDPTAMATHQDPFGPENAEHLATQIRDHQGVGIIVAAWGAHPMAMRYEPVQVLKIALRNAGALCLGVTAKGHPRHPLYVRAEQPLVPWLAATGGPKGEGRPLLSPRPLDVDGNPMGKWPYRNTP